MSLKWLPLLIAPALLTIACGGDGSSPTPSPSPPPAVVPPSPTPTELAKGSSLPAIVDPQELFIADADGGEPMLIHSSASGVGPVAWSPDGTKLAFAVGTVGRPDHKVYVVDVIGEIQAAAEVTGDAVVYALLWSPAGDLVAVGADTANLPVQPVESKVLLIGLDGGSPVEIYSEESPAEEAFKLLSWLSGGSKLLAARGADLVAIDTVTAEVSDIALALGDFRRASLSPDRSRVAFVASSEGDGCQFTVPETLVIVSLVDGTKSEPVSGLCRIGVSDAAWSPDGKEIAYAVAEGEKGAYVLDLASGQSRRVAAPTEEFDVGVEWLDGSGLLVVRVPVLQGGAISREFVFVPAEGGSEQPLWVTRIFTDFGGFAPDARRYLYSDDAVRVGMVGGEAKALTVPDLASAYVSLSWAPAGDRVAYVRTQNRADRRYSVDVETGEFERLPVPAIEGAKVSPDRRLIAFTRSAPQRQLWVANVDGSEERLLVGADGSDVGFFPWSPDSQQIAYVAAAEGHAITVGIANVASGESRVLATLKDWPGEPSWSPDGSRLLVIGDGGELKVIEVATGSSSAVAQGVAVIGIAGLEPQWSPDSTRLLYRVSDEANRWDLMMVNSDGSDGRGLVISPEQELEASWSPDGREVAFWRVTSEPDIRVKRLYAVSVETGQQRELASFKSTGGTDSAPAWSPDGKRIAVFIQSVDEPGMYVVESDGSGVSRVVADTGRPFTDIAWSANGRGLAFTSLYVGL